MRDVGYLLRFYCVVPPVPRLMIGTFAVIAVIAGAAVVSDPGRASGALAPVLLLQLFAASSGFAVPARRGHYDLLLTRGGSRVRAAVAHWVMSIAPGVASWLAVAAVERVASQGSSGALVASGTWAAVFLVSTLPWAFTVALPRFSGGIGWLLVLVTVATTFSRTVLDDWTVGSTRVEALVWPAWTVLVNPWAAVGHPLDHPQLLAVIPALAIAASAMALACRWAACADVPLEAAQ